MAKISKRFKAMNSLVEPGKTYPLDDVIRMLKENSKVKFVEAIDVAVRLGVDARKSDQQVRGSTVLPAGTGKDVRVAVFGMVASGISMLFIGPKVRFHTAASTPVCCQLQRGRVQNSSTNPPYTPVSCSLQTQHQVQSHVKKLPNVGTRMRKDGRLRKIVRLRSG